MKFDFTSEIKRWNLISKLDNLIRLVYDLFFEQQPFIDCSDEYAAKNRSLWQGHIPNK